MNPACFDKRWSALVVLALWAVAGVIAPGRARGEVRVINPVADNSIYRDFPQNTNGGGTGIFAGNNANQTTATRRGLVRFNPLADGLPAFAFVRFASVTLYLSQAQAPAYTHSLHRLTNDWGEGTVIGPSGQGTGDTAQPGDATWDDRASPTVAWDTAGGDYVGVASTSTSVAAQGVDYTWLSTVRTVSDVQSWIDEPSSNFGWILLGDETTTRTAKRFDSRESTTAARRPRLTIDYLRPGDANGDDLVNFNDLVTLARNYNTTGVGFAGGDFTRNGVVDFSDLVLLARNYSASAVHGDTTGFTESFNVDWALAGAMVPEPASVLVLVAGLAFTLRPGR